MYLLDTNVLSELRKIGDGRADARVADWALRNDVGVMFVSVLSLMELDIGIRRMERRDHVKGQRLRLWFDSRVLPEFSPRALAIDSVVALRCAGLHVPDPRSDRDALIAATALVHGLTVVTRNVADFAPTGVNLLNPWQA